jgi:hypothetical protein
MQTEAHPPAPAGKTGESCVKSMKLRGRAGKNENGEYRVGRMHDELWKLIQVAY